MVICISIIISTMKWQHALLIPGYIKVHGESIEAKGLLDSRVDAATINFKLVNKYNLLTIRLPQLLTFQ